MIETYWDTMGKDYQFYITPTQGFIIDFIRTQKCESVFEAAVGTGIIPKVLRKRIYEGAYLGSDYVDTFLKHAKKNNPNEKFIKVDLSKEIPLKPDSFDCSIVHHGLDYVYPYKDALSELKRISKKYIFITLWQPFTEEENEVRFTKEGGWNVNRYNKEEWYFCLKSLGLKILIDAEIQEWNAKYQKQVYNHLFILIK